MRARAVASHVGLEREVGVAPDRPEELGHRIETGAERSQLPEYP
jgi:hypothetical protein